jgi:myo-inositol-1(or 4)-monophosphatase
MSLVDGPSPLLTSLGDLTRRAGLLAQDERESLSRELKPDGSIVTTADRAVETFLRKELPCLIDGTGVWGEEFGFEEEGPEGLWVVDPIDGTSNFAFGSPLWGVSVGLIRGEQIDLGAIYLPDLDELYLAESGHGVFRNGLCLPPIKPGPILDEELVSYGDSLIREFPKVRFPGRMRCSGAFVVDGTFVASQRYRGLVGNRERLYDIAPCVLMGQELGAEVRYADGSPMSISALLNSRIQRPWLIFPSATGFKIE